MVGSVRNRDTCKHIAWSGSTVDGESSQHLRAVRAFQANFTFPIHLYISLIYVPRAYEIYEVA